METFGWFIFTMTKWTNFKQFQSENKWLNESVAWKDVMRLTPFVDTFITRIRIETNNLCKKRGNMQWTMIWIKGPTHCRIGFPCCVNEPAIMCACVCLCMWGNRTEHNSIWLFMRACNVYIRACVWMYLCMCFFLSVVCFSVYETESMYTNWNFYCSLQSNACCTQSSTDNVMEYFPSTGYSFHTNPCYGLYSNCAQSTRFGGKTMRCCVKILKIELVHVNFPCSTNIPQVKQVYRLTGIIYELHRLSTINLYFQTVSWIQYWSGVWPVPFYVGPLTLNLFNDTFFYAK